MPTPVALFVAGEMCLIDTPRRLRLLAGIWHRALVPMLRVVGIIDVTAEIAGAMKPRTRAYKHIPGKPLWAVVAGRSAAIRSHVVITVGTRGATPMLTLSCACAFAPVTVEQIPTAAARAKSLNPRIICTSTFVRPPLFQPVARERRRRRLDRSCESLGHFSRNSHDSTTFTLEGLYGTTPIIWMDTTAMVHLDSAEPWVRYSSYFSCFGFSVASMSGVNVHL